MKQYVEMVLRNACVYFKTVNIDLHKLRRNRHQKENIDYVEFKLYYRNTELFRNSVRKQSYLVVLYIPSSDVHKLLLSNQVRDQIIRSLHIPVPNDWNNILPRMVNKTCKKQILVNSIVKHLLIGTISVKDIVAIIWQYLFTIHSFQFLLNKQTREEFTPSLFDSSSSDDD